jgi:hypothetical protein
MPQNGPLSALKGAKNPTIPERKSIMRLKQKLARHKKDVSSTSQNRILSPMMSWVSRAKNHPQKESRPLIGSGYHGIVDIHPNADFSYKASKNKLSNNEGKAYNPSISTG